MANTVDKVIAIAASEVGYLEKKDGNNLDSKTANAGNANYTKYSRDLKKWIGVPYAQGVAWCDIFVDWVFVMAYGLTEAKKLLGGWSAYTPTSAQYYINNKRWYTTPKVGDQIFFKNSTRINHTGLVVNVDANYVYTIEGNTSAGIAVVPNGGGVYMKKYILTNSKIAGYGRPPYDKKTDVLFRVRVTTHSLTVRSGASKFHIPVGYVHDGDICSITAVQNGWGYIKEKKGWCNLDFTEKI